MTSYHPLVSVVVPTLNESRYLSDLIQSLRHQTYRHFEIIAVDQSTDSTPDICRRAGWVVIPQRTPGIASARAEGFSKAKGEIIASTDADTQLPPRWLEHIVEDLTSPPTVCAYGPAFFPPRPPYRFPNFIEVFFLKLNRLIGRDHILGMNFAVKKSAYLKIGGFNPRLTTAEDVDLGYRLRHVGKIAYDPRLQVTTSPRRYDKYGPLKFLAHHGKNYFSLLFLGKSSTHFEPIRQ